MQATNEGSVYTRRTPRIVSALKLHRRKDRDATGLFLAEGPQAVREALAAGVVRSLYTTTSVNYPGASLVTDDAMAALADTVNPQGVVAVCSQVDVSLVDALAKKPQLVAVLVDIRDPGNAGTILRTADAAGASAVIFAGDTVDPYNGKCVRSSAGSVFHVDVVQVHALDLSDFSDMRTYATTGYGAVSLDEVSLGEPTAWLFGSEAHGLPAEVLDQADAKVRVPIYGGAESLNLAAAAAICLYASARAQRS